MTVGRAEYKPISYQEGQYGSGWGGLGNDETTRRIFTAAMEGNAAAQTKLVRSYCAAAITLCQEPAKQGHAEALLMLGRIHRYSEDHAKAFEYFKQAADQGNLHAIFYVAEAYLNGKGVDPDLGKAIEYFTIAKDRGMNNALGNLGTILTKNDTPYQNIPLGIQYLKEAADKGDHNAQLNLARILLDGVKAPKDVPVALDLYEKSAEKGNTFGYIKIARYYYGEKDFVKALTYFEKAWQAGDEKAMKEVAKMQLQCADLVEGMPLRLECLQFAVGRGDIEAMYQLSKDYFEGKNVAQSVMIGITYLERAALAGHQQAQQKLASLGDKRFKTENKT